MQVRGDANEFGLASLIAMSVDGRGRARAADGRRVGDDKGIIVGRRSRELEDGSTTNGLTLRSSR